MAALTKSEEKMRLEVTELKYEKEMLLEIKKCGIRSFAGLADAWG